MKCMHHAVRFAEMNPTAIAGSSRGHTVCALQRLPPARTRRHRFEPRILTCWCVPVALKTQGADTAWARQGMTIETNYWGDTEWTTNAVSFRCEERIAIGFNGRPRSVS